MSDNKVSRRIFGQGLLGLGATAVFSGIAVDTAEASRVWPYSRESGTCVIDSETGRMLVSDNPFQRCYPASLTKIVTAMVVIDAVRNDEFSRGYDSRINPTSFGLTRARWDTPDYFKRMRARDSFTIREALSLVGGRSNNCLSSSLAEWTGDGRTALAKRQDFYRRMNRKVATIIGAALEQARGLDMGPEFERAYPNRRPDTNFINADGMDTEGSAQITNPWEMAHLMSYFYKNYAEEAVEFFGQPTVDWPGRGINDIAVTHRLIPDNPAMRSAVSQSVSALNSMADVEPGEEGPHAPLSSAVTFVISQRMVRAGKTGYLGVSGNNLANAAEFNGRTVAAAVLGANGRNNSINNMSDALVSAYGITHDMLAHPDGNYTPSPSVPPPARPAWPELPQLY